MYDVAIIGAGISGSLIAHELSKYDLKIAVFEKEADMAQGASGANSAIVHSGHDPIDRTLKAKFNVLGNRMFKGLCEELQVAYKEIGAFVCATNKQEEETLMTLYERAKSRDIKCELLEPSKALELEPNLSDDVTKVLSLPTTGIITPWEVVISAMEEANINGTDVFLETEVKTLEYKDGIYTINEQYQTKVLIDAAGVYADDIYRLLAPCDYDITPRKGEYFILDHLKHNVVNRVIYPVPGKKGKGVLVVPTIHNNILLGPNSDPIDYKDDISTSNGLDYVKANVTKTVKNIPFNKIIHTYAGLRPSGNYHDFVIKEDDDYKNFIHVACIESPGLASSPAIAKYVCDELVLPKFESHLKENYIRRTPLTIMNNLSLEEKNQKIKENPEFGEIVCRCEKISKAEVKEAINRPLGATSIKGVKRRVRPGMGACQGGFCEPLIFKILKEELNLKDEEVKYDGQGSEVMKAKAKELL